MANKKLIKKMIEEKELEITSTEEQIERQAILERFMKRQSFSKPGKVDQMLIQIKTMVEGYKKSIQANKEFIKYLQEIEHE